MSDRPLITPLAYQRKHAAAALDVSVDTFDRRIRPDLRCVYIGDTRLYPVTELQRWLAQEAAIPVVCVPHTKRPRTVDAAGGMAQEASPS